MKPTLRRWVAVEHARAISCQKLRLEKKEISSQSERLRARRIGPVHGVGVGPRCAPGVAHDREAQVLAQRPRGLQCGSTAVASRWCRRRTRRAAARRPRTGLGPRPLDVDRPHRAPVSGASGAPIRPAPSAEVNEPAQVRLMRGALRLATRQSWPAHRRRREHDLATAPWDSSAATRAFGDRLSRAAPAGNIAAAPPPSTAVVAEPQEDGLHHAGEGVEVVGCWSLDDRTLPRGRSTSRHRGGAPRPTPRARLRTAPVRGIDVVRGTSGMFGGASCPSAEITRYLLRRHGSPRTSTLAVLVADNTTRGRDDAKNFGPCSASIGCPKRSRPARQDLMSSKGRVAFVTGGAAKVSVTHRAPARIAGCDRGGRRPRRVGSHTGGG